MIKKILERFRAEKEAYSDTTYYVYGLEAAMKIVQEVAKEYEWIPVETELPKDWELIYATCVSLVDNREPWVIEGIYFSGCGGFERMTPMLEYGDAKVIAWMPKKLPTPYQKGE